MSQSKNWCFTDFELLDWMKIWKSDDEQKIRYIGWGEEICPKTGRKHYQGWIQFTTRRRLGGVKNIVGSKKIHLETCKGTEEANEKYCRKDNAFRSVGKYIKQGQRRDLEEIKELIEKNPTEEYMVDEFFETYCRYKNGMDKWLKICQKRQARKEFRKVQVDVIFGPTGTGKTKYAMEHADMKISGDDMQWWDSYDQEKTICIDEYDSQVSLTKLLGLLDGYEHELNVKGSKTYAAWNRVIITSNVDPREWHMNAKWEHRLALMRRLTNVIKLDHGCAEVLRGNTKPVALTPRRKGWNEEMDEDFE